MDFTYPGGPRTTLSTESDFPCWLERLEVLIRLEKSFDRQRVDNAECQKSAEDEEPLGVVGYP